MSYEDICDAHVLIGPDDSEIPYAREYTAARVVDLLGESGVSKAAVFAPRGVSDADAANRRLARVCREYRDFHFFARLRGELVEAAPAPWLPSTVETVEDAAGELGALGFTIDPLGEGYPDAALIAAVFDTRLPVIIHGDADMDLDYLVAEWLDRRSGIPVVLSHLGGWPQDRFAVEDAVDLARSYPDLYLNTAGWTNPYILRGVIRDLPERILFGSGAPETDPAVAAQAIVRLGLSPADKRRVLSENFLELMDWVDAE